VRLHQVLGSALQVRHPVNPQCDNMLQVLQFRKCTKHTKRLGRGDTPRARRSCFDGAVYLLVYMVSVKLLPVIQLLLNQLLLLLCWHSLVQRQLLVANAARVVGVYSKCRRLTRSL
jgi:hypothetical protein